MQLEGHYTSDLGSVKGEFLPSPTPVQSIVFMVQKTYYRAISRGGDFMAGKTTNITIRMDSEIKAQAEVLFGELGMNLTTALNIFVRQSLREGRIPFEICY